MIDLVERTAAIDKLCGDCKSEYGGRCPHPQGMCHECESIWQTPKADIPTVNHWISCSERLPDMRTRVFVEAVRDRKHYPKDTEPSRMFIAMRIEMLSDCEWYWANATDMYGYDGIGGMLALGGWEVVAWMPMPDAYEPPGVNSNE